jgi:hypothetical protein
MRISLIWIGVILLALAFAPGAQSGGPLPMIGSVEPQSGKPGDLITARGSNLGSDSVAAVYLTDGATDTKAVLVQQSATEMKFKIPAGLKPGRLALMVLTAGSDAKLIEEPVKLTIDPDTDR